VPGWPELLEGPAPEVVPRLLGGILTHRTDAGTVSVQLTEVEAYAGEQDPGSHAYRGPTPRNAVMFGPPGHLYVYFTYGMHHCCNVVCGPDGQAAAVLLRAGKVIEGIDLARERRGRGTDRDLARGPARLCTSLGIDLRHNGANLGAGTLTLSVLEEPSPTTKVDRGPRVGLRHAAERSWRFWVAQDPTVSTYRPAKPSTPRPA
jgi:DNA-3-methyladenine glycosylase